MGQPITVVEKPSFREGIVRYEINRSLTGMGHERYAAGDEVTGDAPADELARRVAVNDILAVTAADVALHYDAVPSLLRRVSEADVPLETAEREPLKRSLFLAPSALAGVLMTLTGATESLRDYI